MFTAWRYSPASTPVPLEYDQLFWSVSIARLIKHLGTSPLGLSQKVAVSRLLRDGENELKPIHRLTRVQLLLRQFRSPIAVLLICSAGLSAAVGETVDGIVILSILLVSATLGFWQEHRAHASVQQLLGRLEIRVRVRRDGSECDIPITNVVQGDVVSLSAGSKVPADCRLLESRDLFVDEAVLTGESYPSEKR